MASVDSCLALYFPEGSLFAPDLGAGLNIPCLKLAVSKALGIGIVLGSALVKLPQVVKIVQAGNVDGLSPASITLDLVATMSAFCYFVKLGYAFSTWGENAFLLVQNAAIFALYFHYKHGFGQRFFLAATLISSLGVVLYMRLLPDLLVPPALCTSLSMPRCIISCEDVAGGLPILLSFCSRVPQIVQNVRQRHTGQLAFATYFLNTVGGLARVFTTLQELNDPLTLALVVSSLVQNGTVLMQILAYRGRSAADELKKPQ